MGRGQREPQNTGPGLGVLSWCWEQSLIAPMLRDNRLILANTQNYVQDV